MNQSPIITPVTRRNFITTAGVATVGALAASRFAYAQGNDTLKIALVGAGGRGSGAANQALNVPGTKLVAIADAFKDRLEGALANLKSAQGDKVDVPAERQFTGLDGYKQAIALADVVILATPPGYRPIHFEEAVRQGKHVFAEKPVATDAPVVRKVLAGAAQAKEKDPKVGNGPQPHHQGGYLETIKRLHDGAIGDIHTMRTYWNDAGVWVNPRKEGQTEMEYQMRNWYYFVWLGGDHIVEQHIHNLDVANWVLNGYPVKARGMGGRQVRTGKEFGEIYDHHAVEFFYENGATNFSQCRHIRGCWSSVSEHAVGSKGICDVSGYSIKPKGGEGWRYKGKDKDPYQVEHDDLFAAIRNNLPYNEAFNGAKSTMTAILGRLATYSGVEVSWEDALNSNVDLHPDNYSWDTTPKTLAGPDGFYPVAIPGKTKVV